MISNLLADIVLSFLLPANLPLWVGSPWPPPLPGPSPPATPAGEAATSSEPPAPAPGSPTARTPTAVHPMFCKAPGSPRPAKLKAEAEVDKAVEALRSPVLRVELKETSRKGHWGLFWVG